jgi:uncharacterized protein DUF5670
MLWIIGGVLAFLWLFGVMSHVGGSFIHLLLIVALIMFVVHYRAGRRTV